MKPKLHLLYSDLLHRRCTERKDLMNRTSGRGPFRASVFFIKHLRLTYTLLFLATLIPVFSFFFLNGKTLVMAGDGFMQHYKALLYYSRWMRSLLRSFFIDHSLSFPSFSFSMGLGSDLFTTLQYYVIGDPFALPAFMVPMRYMLYYYEFMIFFRLYCAGLAFLAFAGYKKKSPAGSLAGSLTYCFSSWVMYASVKHPFFTNPMIWFPLLLLGVEKYRQEKRPGVLTAAVALAASSNFYFFYMLVLLTIAYVLLVSFVPFRKNLILKNILTLLKIGGYSFAGVLLSAVFLLPALFMYFGDARSKNGYRLDLLYPLRYYSKFFAGLVASDSVGRWTFAGVSAVALLAVFLLLKKRGKNRLRLKIAYITAAAGLLLPLAGYAFNGFSYSANRWSWAFCFLTAYILADIWPDLFHLSFSDAGWLTGCFGLYLGVCWLSGQGQVSNNFRISAVLMAAALLLLFLTRAADKDGTCASVPARRRLARIPGPVSPFLFMLLLSAGIFENAYFSFSTGEGNYISQFCDADTFTDRFNFSEAAAVQQAADTDNGFYRYSGSRLIRNTSIFSGLKNSQLYWSFTNGNVTSLYNKTLTTLRQISSLNGFDSRTFLEELASTEYYVVTERSENEVPYGYQQLSETTISGPDGKIFNYKVYKNQYALPLGYTYSASISEEEADQMSPLERQEAMLSTVILENSNSGISAFAVFSPSVREIPCENLSKSSDDISIQGNSFVAAKAGEKILIPFYGSDDAETYLAFKNLRFTDSSGYSPPSFDIEVRISSDTAAAPSMKKKFLYENSNYDWYNGRKDYLINLGYSRQARNLIAITFPKAGTYSFDSLNIYCQSMSTYKEKAESLKEDVLENTDLHENDVYATSRVTGTISLTREKILCLSIPYSSGWTAYVDGKKAELTRANYAYMALCLEKGDHAIELRYHTPGLAAGAVISAGSLLFFGASALFRKKALKLRNKKSQKNPQPGK